MNRKTLGVIKPGSTVFGVDTEDLANSIGDKSAQAPEMVAYTFIKYIGDDKGRLIVGVVVKGSVKIARLDGRYLSETKEGAVSIAMEVVKYAEDNVLKVKDHLKAMLQKEG